MDGGRMNQSVICAETAPLKKIKKSHTVVMAALPPCGKQNLAICVLTQNNWMERKKEKLPT